MTEFCIPYLEHQLRPGQAQCSGRHFSGHFSMLRLPFLINDPPTPRSPQSGLYLPEMENPPLIFLTPSLCIVSKNLQERYISITLTFALIRSSCFLELRRKQIKADNLLSKIANHRFRILTDGNACNQTKMIKCRKFLHILLLHTC